jgi:hypothetical protein
MSGVYRILMCKSNFAQGLFTQTLNMSYNHEYEMSKIEQLRKDEKKHADFYDENGQYKGDDGTGGQELWPSENPTQSDRGNSYTAPDGTQFTNGRITYSPPPGRG